MEPRRCVRAANSRPFQRILDISRRFRPLRDPGKYPAIDLASGLPNGGFHPAVDVDELSISILAFMSVFSLERTP